MKKHSKNLFKRLLASSLALAMCSSMVCTTAFAEEDPYGEYAYVYIAIEVKENGTAETPPSFDDFAEGNKEAKQEIKDLQTKLDAAQETANKAEAAVSENASVFESKDALDVLEGAVTEAAKEVTEKLDSLVDTDKPEYAADSETNEPAESDKPEGTDKNGEPEGTESSDLVVKDVNQQVMELNDARNETDQTVSAAVDKANETQKELLDAINDVNKGLEHDQIKLEDAKRDAQEKVEKAEKAVSDCEDKQAQLEAELKDKIDALTKPSETAPARQEDQSEADYVAAYNAWVTELEAYNRQLEGIRAEHAEAVQELNDQSEVAKQAVAEAQAALDQAEADLDALNKVAEREYGKLTEQSDDLKEHEEMLGNYNGKVDAYNEAAEKYNNAAETYNKAVEEYNDAAKDFNEEVKDYNDAVKDYKAGVAEYDKALADYETAASEYNGRVNDYNKTAYEWNVNNKSDTLMAEVLDDLNIDIKVYYQVDDALKADMEGKKDEKDEKDDPLSDPDKIATYNEVIREYNNRVKNQTAEDRLDELTKCFDGQKAWTSNDNGKTTQWYSLGKIAISDEDIGARANDYKPGTEVYEWNYDNTGNEWQGTMKSEALGINDAFNGLEPDLKEPTFTISNYVADGYKALVKESSIDKWVLVVSNGANDDQLGWYVPSGDGTNKNTWHINGYMCVNKLSQLAELEARVAVDKKDYAVKTEVQSVELKADTPLAGVKEYEKPDNTKPVDITPPTETWDTRPADPADFAGVQLNVTVPSYLTVPERITPTPAPTPTDPIIPGGGGGDDDDDDTTVVNIPDTEVPLTDEPEIEIPDDDVPLTDIPDEDVPLTDIPDEDVPLSDEVEILDDQVPLADVPKTGDISAMWYAVTLVSACALAALMLRRRENG